MEYTITKNAQFNSLEIAFAGKPSEKVREALKALKFRWHAQKKIWYGYTDEETARAAINGQENGQTEENAETVTDNSTEIKAQFVAALREVWGKDEKMVIHCTNKAAELVRLENGFIVEIEKHSIETRFCFGYSLSHTDTEDCDNANRMADHARKSAEYFKAENMRPFISALEEFDDDQKILVFRRQYIGQSESNPLHTAEFVRDWKIIQALGGSARLDALPGSTIVVDGRPVYIGTEADKAALRAGYEKAMKAHEKKVDAYLKRYGTSKVHSWSYWQDA